MSVVFSYLGPILTTGLKMYRTSFPKIFFALKLSHKNVKVSQARCNWFDFHEGRAL